MIRIRKTRDKESYDIVVTVDNKDAADTLMPCLAFAVDDHRKGLGWIGGLPTKDGVYIVELEETFTLVRMKDGTLNELNDKPLTAIKRYFFIREAL